MFTYVSLARTVYGHCELQGRMGKVDFWLDTLLHQQDRCTVLLVREKPREVIV